jgi:hypothetical protein
MSEDYYDMSEDYYNMSKDLIKSGNLEELKNLYKNGILTREVIKQSRNFLLFENACYEGKLEICKWLCKTFQITKEEASKYLNLTFFFACKNGHLKVCQWLCEEFQITKKEAMSYNNLAFQWACHNNHYHIISFLCNTFDIKEKDVKDVIMQLSEEKQKKILDCFISFGSFTKPAK